MLKRPIFREYTIYSLQDEAIDPISNMEEYRKTLDASHLVFIDGKLPTKFIVRPLKTWEKAQSVSSIIQAQEYMNIVESSFIILQSCLIRIENLESDPITVINRDLLDSFSNEAIIVELANYVRELSTLPLAFSK